MIRRRIWYILLLSYTFYSVLLYSFRGLRFLLAVLILVPAASFIQVLVQGFFCRLTLEDSEATCVRDEDRTTEIIFDNRGVVPVSRVRVWLEWRTPGGGVIRKKEWLHAVEGKERSIFPVSMPTEHCGQVSLAVKKVKIYDYLGLCTMRIRRPVPLGAWVLPKREPLDISGMENALFSGRMLRKGRDDMEEYEIRNYRPGDSLHRIHWKLSIKEEELQIRDYSSSRVGGSAVFLELPAEDGRNPDSVDKYLDRAFSLFFALFHSAGGLERVAWQECGEYKECEILAEEDIYACILQVLASISQKGSGTGTDCKDMLPVDMFRLSGNLCLYMGEWCIYE